VPLSLQLLLENAVKHNISSQRPFVNLHWKWFLVIQNDYQKKSVTRQSKVGLQNIINRYAIITKRKW
jgi:LytS/YehU family sensor histidine kinase